MKRYRKKTKRKLIEMILLQIFLICIILVCSKFLVTMIHTDDIEPDNPTSTLTPSKDAETVNSNSAFTIHLDSDRLSSSNAILIRLSDLKVLYEKDSDKMIYPASLTKIMTTILAIENLTDLSQPIELSSDMFSKLYSEDASMAGFLPGETVLAIDLLYGVLLPSGAECCIGLSEYIAGSEESFVTQMNAKALALGMNHTHFMNCTGLNDEEHYTTVTDLSNLLEYALQNDTFREIFTSSRHSTSSTSLHPEGITFHSTMFENLISPEFDGGVILGGKTGFTDEAGLCLASLASISNHEYILITTGASGNHKTEQFNITDALFVYECLH